ncbi:MAG: hypothetical protein HKN23_18760 [Verrucomicrobiales bacterium]|nr:hypothetical protein [Verrucomicrobiales bacterium]
MFGKHRRKRYREKIARGLRAAHASAPVEDVVLDELKLIVFSDHHRGTGDRADDFRKCRRLYHAALGYYDSLRYRLFLLGDVEEMWERILFTILATYRPTLDLEQRFFERGEAERFVGNHDENLGRAWNYNQIRGFIADRPLLETLRLRVREKPDDDPETSALGELFFAHGHQGVKYHWYHRFAVRRIWAFWQLLTGVGPGVPSRDLKIRLTHERAMYEWATQEQEDLLLICGHTHNPVFMSTAWQETVRAEVEELSRKEDASADEIAVAMARLRWAEAAAQESKTALPDGAKPCYFNAGCCSFHDGDLTGIEISEGRIRLVHWSGEKGLPERNVLREADLQRVFSKCCDCD